MIPYTVFNIVVLVTVAAQIAIAATRDNRRMALVFVVHTSTAATLMIVAGSRGNEGVGTLVLLAYLLANTSGGTVAAYDRWHRSGEWRQAEAAERKVLEKLEKLENTTRS